MISKERYGSWALIVGGSEGIGEHLARKLGAAGINLVLVARKPEPLAETSRTIRAQSGVEVLTLQLDIASDDMLERVREVTNGLDVGLLVHNVGGGASFGPFVEGTLQAAMSPVLTNCVALTKLEDVAQQALDQLPNGPVYVLPENVEYFNSLYAMSRREAAELQRNLLRRMIPG